MTKTYNVFTGDGQTIATETAINALTAALAATGSGPAASGSLTTLASVQDSNNTNLSTLASGSIWTGSWGDCIGYAQIVTNLRSNKSGSPSVIDLDNVSLRLVPGDVLTICLQSTQSATTSITINGNDT